MDKDTFKFTMPAQLEKSKSGKWKIKGLASEEVVDRQGEIIIQKGMSLDHIDAKRGLINWDHDNSPECTIGILTGYHRDGKRTYIEGELFKGHDKAKAVYGIMKGLQENGSRAMGISIEGKVVARNPTNPKIIEKCIVKNVALTLNPVFDGSYAELVKSFNGAAQVEFDSTDSDDMAPAKTSEEPKIFTATELVDLVAKALSVSGAAATSAPGELSGGEALAQESLDSKPKKTDSDEDVTKPRKLKKGSKDLYKSYLNQILDKAQVLYPDNSRAEIWAALKDRMAKRFPDQKQD